MPKNSVPPLSESAVKGQICDFLDVKMASGSLYWDRLNVGFLKNRIRLCRPGTADLIVLKGEFDSMFGGFCRVIYLELKKSTGKQRDGQKAFQFLVECQCVEYYVVRSLDDVMEILGG